MNEEFAKLLNKYISEDDVLDDNKYMGALNSMIHDLIEERDIYRKALEEINKAKWWGSGKQLDFMPIFTTALTALEKGKEIRKDKYQ